MWRTSCANWFWPSLHWTCWQQQLCTSIFMSFVCLVGWFVKWIPFICHKSKKKPTNRKIFPHPSNRLRPTIKQIFYGQTIHSSARHCCGCLLTIWFRVNLVKLEKGFFLFPNERESLQKIHHIYYDGASHISGILFVCCAQNNSLKCINIYDTLNWSELVLNHFIEKIHAAMHCRFFFADHLMRFKPSHEIPHGKFWILDI